MRVIKNQPVIQKLSETISNNEISNIAMVVETPTILTDWFLVCPDRTTTVDGWKNIDRYIGEDSQVVYDLITEVPMGGISDLTTNINFDEETGYDENFQTTGMIYPNTVGPIPGSFFIIHGSERFALYQVTDINLITMRSNPFVEVTFRLASRDPKKLTQLRKQVHEEYTTCLSSMGTNKSLIIRKDMVDTLWEHIGNYLDMVALYKDLFYRSAAAAFMFDGLPDKDGNRACFIDMTLWRLLFDERIIVCDDIVAYANANQIKTIEPFFTSCPDIMVEDHTYQRSILYRIYSKKTKGVFDEYRYPYIWNPTERITKYQGKDIWYVEGYQNFPSSEFSSFLLWDDEFLCRIRQNDPYPIGEGNGMGDSVGPACNPQACASCTQHCRGNPVSCFNPYLRNVIIKWINGEEIDFIDEIEIADAHTIENYYLIPLVIGIYKQYIHDLKDKASGTTL